MNQDFTQNELKRLAGIAGREIFTDENLDMPFMAVKAKRKGMFQIWEPHEDLNQAFECLEGLGKSFHIIKCLYAGDMKDASYFDCIIEMSRNAGDDKVIAHKNLKIAICKAVLEASKC